jgi:OOP family OmpA-OmpF porin
MRTLQWLTVLAVTALLAACSSDIQRVRSVEPTGSPFTRTLTQEYADFSAFEADEMYDWRDARHFARKGILASQGEVVQPEELANWDLPADSVDELAAARSKLVGLLDANARDTKPEIAAHAQGAFDCWVEQQEENHQPDHIAACRDEFYAALAKLEEAMKPAPEPMMPKAQPEPFGLFFAFDSAVLTAEAESTINAAVAAAQDAGMSEFSVTGHADRSGSEEYNVGLSIRRGEAVRDALIARGINASAVSVAGRGESDPAVPTADGVREQANRRVVIILQ